MARMCDRSSCDCRDAQGAPAVITANVLHGTKSARKDRRTPKAPPFRDVCGPRASPALAGECGCSFCRFGLSYRQLLIILRPTLSSLTLRSSACLLGLCVRNLLESFVSILSFHSFKMVLPVRTTLLQTFPRRSAAGCPCLATFSPRRQRKAFLRIRTHLSSRTLAQSRFVHRRNSQRRFAGLLVPWLRRAHRRRRKDRRRAQS